jgi:Rrf2 family protein
VRISAKTDYAVRAMTQLAVMADNGPVTADQLATAQGIPLKFLLGILNELKRAHLLRSQRGAEGGYLLRRPPAEISLADVIRAIDGPLANVHDLSLETLEYPEPADELRTIWMAVRGSLRSVLETVSIEDLAIGKLPRHVRALADKYQADVKQLKR